MKTRLIIALLATLLFASGLFAWDFNHKTFFDVTYSYARRYASTTFSNLGTPSNNTVYYCSDCTQTNPCAGSGSGAVAQRINGAWQCGSGATASPGGSNTQVQFNDSSSFGGDSGLTYNKTTDVLTVVGAYVVGTNPASTGAVRLPNNTAIYGRNAANSADIKLIGTNTSNQIVIGSSGSDYTLLSGTIAATGTLGGDSLNIGSGWWVGRPNSNGGIAVGSGMGFYWGSGATNTTDPPSGDVSLTRIAPGVIAFANGSNGSTTGGNIKIGSTTAKPACDSTTRGYVYHVYGGAGVKDTVETCAKDAADAYAWRTIY